MTGPPRANFEIPEEWVEEADERNLSISEYCRRMIRAGRRQFGVDYERHETPANPETLKIDDTTTSSEIEPMLKEWVLSNLSTDTALSSDDLVDLLEGDIVRLLDELCDEEKVKYRATESGYLKANDE